MSRGNVDVEIHADRAINQLKQLEESIRLESDGAVREMSEQAAQNAVDTLLDNSSVATETGIRSLEGKRMGKRHYATVGRHYLKYVDEGTQPHEPEINYRFVRWAQQEGWNIAELSSHIEDEGTKPHAWMANSFDPVIKKAPETFVTYLRRNVNF